MKTLKKIVLFPVRLLLSVFKLAFAILIRIEAYVIAVVLLPIILSVFACVVCKMWIQLRIMGFMILGVSRQ